MRERCGAQKAVVDCRREALNHEVCYLFTGRGCGAAIVGPARRFLPRPLTLVQQRPDYRRRYAPATAFG
jgi:hypothetical protein